MGLFPSAEHPTALAGLAPGNNQSSRKRHRTKTREGSRGKKRAILAAARSLLVSFYHMLSRREPYQDPGGDYFDKPRKEVKVNILTKQLKKLGCSVQLETINLQSAAS